MPSSRLQHAPSATSEYAWFHYLLQRNHSPNKQYSSLTILAMLIKAQMQHWILCMSSWYCLSPFRKLLLKRVHQNLIRWISIMRMLRESPTLTSLLISFTRSISHLSLAILATDCHVLRLLRLKLPIMVVTKTLVSITTGLPFRHALLTARGDSHCQTIWKSQLPPLNPKHGLLRSTLQFCFLTDEV